MFHTPTAPIPSHPIPERSEETRREEDDEEEEDSPLAVLWSRSHTMCACVRFGWGWKAVGGVGSCVEGEREVMAGERGIVWV